MSNPFLNLRKYSDWRDVVQQENHATESLAACLQFSPALKAAFVQFLFKDEPLPFDRSLVEQLEIATQETAGKFKLDLYLFIPSELDIIVEVKVKAPEDAQQLKDYDEWLQAQTGKHKFLFSLVKRLKPDFEYQPFVRKRLTWRELASAFRRFVENNDSPEYKTDHNVARFFRDYLEAQQIVTNWKASSLKSLEVGLRARRALSSIFKILSDRLTPEFTTKIIMTDEYWPRIEIGKSSWESIFGQGYNNRICVFFCVPGTLWKAEEHKFYPRIGLWGKSNDDDWVSTEPKLQNWVAQLQAVNFTHIVQTKRNTDYDFNFHNKLPPNPTLIAAHRNADEIGEAELARISEDELIERLYQTVISYAALIDTLR